MSRKLPVEKERFKNLIVPYDEEISPEGEKEVLSETKYADDFIWAVAEGKKEAEGYTEKLGTISVNNADNIRLYRPLNDPDLFLSFTRLGNRREHLDDRILNWIRRYGLLRIGESDVSQSQRRKFTSRRVGKPQHKDPRAHAHEQLDAISRDVDGARSAASLYKDLNHLDIASLKSRATKLDDEEERKLTNLEELTVKRWSVREDHKGILETTRLWWTIRDFENFMREKLSEVQVSLSLPTMFNPYPSYVPERSYRCPDLISAIYLQFYLAITEAMPMKICANRNCLTPFPAKRKDNIYCCPGCRSSGRPSRRKEV